MSKGDGAAGGGLAARIRAWEAAPGALVAPNVKHLNVSDASTRTHHRPGSQNHRKGGRGRKG